MEDQAPTIDPVIDFGYRELAARRERLLARCSEATRLRILGLPPAHVPARTHAITVDLATGVRTVRRVPTGLPSPIAVDPARLHRRRTTRLSFFRIVKAVCEAWRIGPDKLLSTSRSATCAPPRYAAFRLVRELLGWSTKRSGRAFRRDHTTIGTGLRRAATLHAHDGNWRRRYERARASLMRGAG